VRAASCARPPHGRIVCASSARPHHVRVARTRRNAPPPIRLDETTLLAAVDVLTARDADLARVVEAHGPPPLWARPTGFATLVYIILEQQVSLASARAAFERLLVASGGTPAPERFLRFNDAELLSIGFSRQKAGYVRRLSEDLLTGGFDLDAMAAMDDAHAHAALVRLHGVGPWTADIYLLEALLRRDIWPVGDLALATAVQEVKGLATRPTPAELGALGEAWRPWRGVAARICWHDYLRRRGRSAGAMPGGAG
jgi:DNA-3-methyladenine glycosylase II